MSFTLRFECRDLPYAVVIEDDDRVAYAYLLLEEKIIGDVWLYNVIPGPRKPDWGDRSNLPFANPHEFALHAPPITDQSSVTVDWVLRQGSLARAEVYRDQVLWAMLAPGSKPGWCSNARKTGPLARVLESKD
jgi:hypothetical protein